MLMAALHGGIAISRKCFQGGTVSSLDHTHKEGGHKLISNIQ